MTNQSVESPMQHFHVGNIDQIKDAPPELLGDRA